MFKIHFEGNIDVLEQNFCKVKSKKMMSNEHAILATTS